MELLGVEGDFSMKGLKPFGIGNILDEPSVKGFTLGDVAFLGVGGNPIMKGFKPFGIGDILGDSSVKGFNLGNMEVLGVEGVGDWLSKAVGDIEGDP